MSSDTIIIKCDVCDYKSKWRYNMTRHMMRKHNDKKIQEVSQMSTLHVPNVHLPVPNVHYDVPNVHFSENNNL